jgi:hypothetical protein
VTAAATLDITALNGRGLATTHAVTAALARL